MFRLKRYKRRHDIIYGSNTENGLNMLHRYTFSHVYDFRKRRIKFME